MPQEAVHVALGAVFMFVEESLGGKESGRHSRPDRVRLGAAECVAGLD
jgi:hypothetical protein